MRASHLVVLTVGLGIGLVVGLLIRPTPPEPPPGRAPPAEPGPPARVDRGAPSVAEVVSASRDGGETTASAAEPAPPAPTGDRRRVAAVRERLGEFGVRPDETRSAMLDRVVRTAAAEMEAEAAHETARWATARRAIRREADAKLEREIRALLVGEEARELDAALDGKAFVETLPGGDDDDVLSSTGASREKVESIVLATYRRRIGLPEDPHPGIRDAVSRYVDAVGATTDELVAKRGRGFVEAVCSGPTPHTEEARLARKVEDYPVAALEARARLWRLQADLEEAMLPWLDEAQRQRLAGERPSGLRFLVREE